MPVISATQEAEIGGLWFKANLGYKTLASLYLKNKLGSSCKLPEVTCENDPLLS
jgi:hypothetical protein